MRYTNYDIVFQEFPDEITLAINISGCPNGCPGCHSAYLQQNIGDELTDEVLLRLLKRYGNDITCVGWMGGDANPEQVWEQAAMVKQATGGRLRTGWYSGRAVMPPPSALAHLDFVKLGPYVEALGPLRSPTTNQRFYYICAGTPHDITHKFRQTTTNP